MDSQPTPAPDAGHDATAPSDPSPAYSPRDPQAAPTSQSPEYQTPQQQTDPIQPHPQQEHQQTYAQPEKTPPQPQQYQPQPQYSQPLPPNTGPNPTPIALHRLADQPDVVDCPHCHQRAVTRMIKENSGLTYIAGAVLCLFSICLTCLPCIFGWGANVNHFCGACGRQLTHRPHGGPVEIVQIPVPVAVGGGGGAGPGGKGTYQ